MRLKSEGGCLERKGMVEVVSSLRPDGSSVGYDIRKGVWVCIEAANEYIRRCFKEYQVVTDPDGRNMVLYKKWHLIGLELGISVAAVGLRGEPTGFATCFNADVVATAKRALKPGELLDGEGGYTVYGKLFPARKSLAIGGLPLGLAHKLKVVRPVAKDQPLSWDDVVVEPGLSAYRLRKEMEGIYA
jgi:predicted homoserine dehydrogenase-like protein